MPLCVEGKVIKFFSLCNHSKKCKPWAQSTVFNLCIEGIVMNCSLLFMDTVLRWNLASFLKNISMSCWVALPKYWFWGLQFWVLVSTSLYYSGLPAEISPNIPSKYIRKQSNFAFIIFCWNIFLSVLARFSHNHANIRVSILWDEWFSMI